VKVGQGVSNADCGCALLLVYQVGWGGYARFWEYISPLFMRGLGFLVDLRA
jgi:hypothetical protein